MDLTRAEHADEPEPFSVGEFWNQQRVQPNLRPGYPGRSAVWSLNVLNWPNQVQSITAADLSATLARRRIVGIHCWADWNAYDYQFAKGLKSTAAKFGDLIALCSLNVEEPSSIELANVWGLLNIPAFVTYCDGTRLATIWMERETIAEFQQRVDDLLCTLLPESGSVSNGRTIAPN
jgi:hypothetical protein